MQREFYCSRTGSSGRIIAELAANLKKIGIDAIFESDFHTMCPLLGTLEKDDVIICLTKELRNLETFCFK